MIKNATNNTIITCNVSNSICSLLSSVTAFARDLVVGFFPDGYFKDIYISTALAASQQAEIKDDDVPIKNFPQLSITPSFTPDYDDTFGGPYPLWRRGIMWNYKHYSDRYGYKKIFYNSDDNLVVSAIPNRVKFSFDYKIRVETYLQKMELVYTLRQKFHTNDRMFWNNQLLKAQIPNTIIKALASCKGLDLQDDEDKKDFFAYLRNHSNGYIHPMVYTGSGNNTFVHTYSANMLVSVETPPDTDEKSINKNNMSGREETIEMSLSVELWLPNNYMFECNSLPPGRYEPSLDESKIYIYSAVPLRPEETMNEKTLLHWQELVTEVNVPVDTLDLNDFLPKDIMGFIDAQLQKRDYDFLDETFTFVLYRDKKRLQYGKDFTVNWRNKQIKLLNPFYNYSYYIGCYALQPNIFIWNQEMLEKKKKDRNL